MKISLKQLVSRLGASLHVPPGSSENVELGGVGPIDKALPTDVSFLTNPDYLRFASTTKAAAVIVGKVLPDCPRPQIVHKNPYWAFAMTAQAVVATRMESGQIDPEAFVSPQAKIGRGVTIYPLTYVSEGAVVGDRSVLFPGVYLGRDVRLGADSVLRANVVVEDGCVIGDRVLIHGNTTIGADGFGFAKGDDGHAKIPQVGIVRIENDVEIGAGCTVDRAAMGETLIGQDTKLDSSVHVGHGAKIGPHGILCSGAAIGGSAKIGKWSVLAGATSVSNNVELGDHITIGALSGVTKSLREAGEYMGFPAVPANQWRREVAGVRRLKNLEERIRNLEKTMGKTQD
ncbi:MAG: UDP-3-O-(3-hydroxymyristoyl)glucosamine N-acyltransferase [bacterium]